MEKVIKFRSLRIVWDAIVRRVKTSDCDVSDMYHEWQKRSTEKTNENDP